jgi:hypothetical protein
MDKRMYKRPRPIAEINTCSCGSNAELRCNGTSVGVYCTRCNACVEVKHLGISSERVATFWNQAVTFNSPGKGETP